MREKAVKMKSFSLEIPVLEKTIAGLDVSIKNIEQIGIDIVNIADTLVSESWEGEATKSFRENMQDWKTNYDGFVNKIIAFKESLEKVILPKAEEINEKALSLTIALGGARGTGEKNIISMEQEGIEELKAKCKSLVYDAYESELEIMEKVSGLCGRLNYHFNIEESIEQNKKIIEEKQERLEKFKAQLQDYEDSVLELEALTVKEMAQYVTLGGQPMQQDTFKELLKYMDYVNLNNILSKSIDELSDIELIVLQAAYENGDTTIIKKYIGRQLDIQHLTYKQFYKRSNKEQQVLAGQILSLLSKIAPASGREYSSREIPLGRDMSIILYNVDDIMKLVKREKEITQRNGDPTMAHKSVASAPEGADAIMAQYDIHDRLEAASMVTFIWPGASEAIIGIDALIYLCEGDAEGLKKDAMFFGGIVAFKAVGRFIVEPVCNYIGKKVSGQKPKVYAKKLFKKLGFDKTLKQEEKAVSIGAKEGANLADDVIEGGSETISKADRIRIKSWEYTPNDELYLKYKDVYDNPLYYDQATGKMHWPIDDGFKAGSKVDKVIDEGTIFKRYGENSGEFLGNATDSFEPRALAPHSEGAEVHYYQLTEDYKVTAGEAAPWFGSDGGAEQFVKYKPDGSKYTIKELEDAGILEDVTDLIKKGDIKID